MLSKDYAGRGEDSSRTHGLRESVNSTAQEVHSTQSDNVSVLLYYRLPSGDEEDSHKRERQRQSRRRQLHSKPLHAICETTAHINISSGDNNTRMLHGYDDLTLAKQISQLKDCPICRCSIRIIEGGCPHILCEECGQHFCQKCMKPLEDGRHAHEHNKLFSISLFALTWGKPA